MYLYIYIYIYISLSLSQKKKNIYIYTYDSFNRPLICFRRAGVKQNRTWVELFIPTRKTGGYWKLSRGITGSSFS